VPASPILTVAGGYGEAAFTTPESARKAVLDAAGAGAKIIKYSIENFQQGRGWVMPTREEILAIGQAARELGLPSSVHLSWSKHLGLAIEAGVGDIAHMTVDRTEDSALKAVVEAGIVWVPTLELWSNVSKAHGVGYYQIAQDNLRRFIALGGRVALGTDFNGYFTPFERGMPLKELGMLAGAGLAPMAILKAATTTAAEICGLGNTLGSLKPGYVADLIVLGADPSLDPQNLKYVEAVYHGGRLLPSARK
jgi:imidazolonepropionase-like amidohydrolase